MEHSEYHEYYENITLFISVLNNSSSSINTYKLSEHCLKKIKNFKYLIWKILIKYLPNVTIYLIGTKTNNNYHFLLNKYLLSKCLLVINIRKNMHYDLRFRKRIIFSMYVYYRY